MIHINPDRIEVDPEWVTRARALTNTLKGKPKADRSAYIESCRAETWGDRELVKALKKVVGNKCWYSEVPLEGADPNVDHFRPKGDVREVDSELKRTEKKSGGYWWFAFEYRNYRLTSMHANQRRVDEDTEGGKWDFFPVRGGRAAELVDWGAIEEDALALDPCSSSDVALLWFDPNGVPGCPDPRDKPISPDDQERVRVTIWLYHLNKGDICERRKQCLIDLRKDIEKADTDYKLWKHPETPSLLAKRRFDQKADEIRKQIADDAPFAGAKRCAVKLAIADCPWIEEYEII